METHQLDAGQGLALVLPRGSEVVILRGRLQVQRPPLWLAERVVLRTEHWGEGRAVRLDGRECWQVRALEATTLQVLRPQPAWRRLGRAVQAALAMTPPPRQTSPS